MLEVTTRIVGTAPDADAALVLAVQLAGRPEVGTTPTTTIVPKWIRTLDLQNPDDTGELVYEVIVAGRVEEQMQEPLT
jgi:hypothetical protein